MTSATMRPARSAGGGYAEGRGLGLIIFAAVMLAVTGFFNLLDGQMFFIPAYPFWSLLIIAADVVALWGLCVYGSRENLGIA